MGFTQYGTPREILTDHGTQFVSARDRDEAHHTFKEFPGRHGIKHIIARVKHPQTNGKLSGSLENLNAEFRNSRELMIW
jgi:putative transposase